MLTDEQIVTALQGLAQEHFDEGGMGFDLPIGKMALTVLRPLPLHDARAGIIRTGEVNLREVLSDHLEKHLARLVARKLTRG